MLDHVLDGGLIGKLGLDAIDGFANVSDAGGVITADGAIDLVATSCGESLGLDLCNGEGEFIGAGIGRIGGLDGAGGKSGIDGK